MSDTNMSDVSGTTRKQGDWASYTDDHLTHLQDYYAGQTNQFNTWAAMAEAAASYEPNPDTRDEWEKMRVRHVTMADYYGRNWAEVKTERDRRETDLEYAARAAEANDLHTKGLDAESGC